MKQVELVPFLREDARPPELLSERASSPPEVKLPEGSRRSRFFQNKLLPSGTSGASFGKGDLPARGEASRRKRRTPFLREEAEGRAFFKTSWLPSESRHPARGEAFRRKPPEVKLLSESRQR